MLQKATCTANKPHLKKEGMKVRESGKKGGYSPVERLHTWWGIKDMGNIHI